MTLKKLFILLVFFSLSACGYQAIYSQKNITKITISEINTTGDNNINRLIISLTGLSAQETNKNSYILNLNTIRNKEIILKNSSGNAETYKITLQVSVVITEYMNKKNIYKNKQFISSFIFNNKANKFELSQDEQSIVKNLSETIAGQIIVYLST